MKQGLQLITKHGKKTVVVISYAEYENLRKSRGKLPEFFQAALLAGVVYQPFFGKSVRHARYNRQRCLAEIVPGIGQSSPQAVFDNAMIAYDFLIFLHGSTQSLLVSEG